jgi:hypothetical protein
MDPRPLLLIGIPVFLLVALRVYDRLWLVHYNLKGHYYSRRDRAQSCNYVMFLLLKKARTGPKQSIRVNFDLEKVCKRTWNR